MESAGADTSRKQVIDRIYKIYRIKKPYSIILLILLILSI